MSFSGCGKKDMPMPPLKEIPPAPFGIAITPGENGGLKIEWSYAADGNADTPMAEGFEIFAAQRGLSGKDCQGCPLKFEKIVMLPSSAFEYYYPVVKGYRYFIRLRTVSGFGGFSPWSETVEVDYK